MNYLCVSPLTPITVCLHCHSAPAVLLVLLQGRYKEILQLSVRETQQDCEGDKIHFRKNSRSSSSATIPEHKPDEAVGSLRKPLQTISVSSSTCLIYCLGVTNNANNFRFSLTPNGDNKNSSRLTGRETHFVNAKSAELPLSSLIFLSVLTR